MFKRTILASFLIGSAFLASTALASDTGFYVGGGVGQSDYSSNLGQQIEDAYDGDFVFAYRDSGVKDDADTAYKLFAGYRVLPWLGVEAAWVDLGAAKSFYQLHSNNLSNFDPLRNGEYQLRGASVSIFGELHFNDQFSAIVRVGAFNARLRYNETGLDQDGDEDTFRHSDTSTQTTAGVGLNWRITPAWDLRADYDRYFDIGERFALNETGNGRFDSVDMFSLNLAYRFGR